MRKNKKLIMAMAIVLAIATAAAGTTFAWFTANDGKINHMETGQLTNGDVHIVEVFPEDELRPGDILDKEVKTVNGGSVDALVRLSFAEVVQMLDNDGATEGRAAVWAGPVNAATPEIPQLFNEALLATGGAYANWVELDLTDASAGPFAAISFDQDLDGTADTIPTGMTVLYKEFIVDEGGPNETKSYTFVVYGEIAASAVAAPATGEQDFRKYNGKLQYATGTFDVDSTVKTALELTVSNIDFKVFEYAATIQNKWALLNDKSDGIDLTTGFLQLTDATTPKLPVIGDFKTSTTDVTATSTPTWDSLNLGAALKSPSDPGSSVNSGERMIELYFGDKFSFAADPDGLAADSWWYNQIDGYFYYIGKLAPGQATSNLLENVGLNSSAEDRYNNLMYDLIVKMEAIQNIEEAISASNGWNLDAASAALLIPALKTVNALSFS